MFHHIAGGIMAECVLSLASTYTGSMNDGPYSELRYILTWHDRTDGHYLWSIRGLFPDRRFYGDVIDRLNRRGFTIEGKLSDAEYDRVFRLVEELEDLTLSDTAPKACDGKIFRGPIERPNIIYAFPQSADCTSGGDLLFQAVIDALAPHVRKFY